MRSVVLKAVSLKNSNHNTRTAARVSMSPGWGTFSAVALWCSSVAGISFASAQRRDWQTIGSVVVSLVELLKTLIDSQLWYFEVYFAHDCDDESYDDDDDGDDDVSTLILILTLTLTLTLNFYLKFLIAENRLYCQKKHQKCLVD